MDSLQRHHFLEDELYRLRLLRNLDNPEYSSTDEDAILNEMEALWYHLSPEEQRILEAERARGDLLRIPSVVPAGDLPAVDVAEEEYRRRCLAPRREQRSV